MIIRYSQSKCDKCVCDAPFANARLAKPSKFELGDGDKTAATAPFTHQIEGLILGFQRGYFRGVQYFIQGISLVNLDSWIKVESAARIERSVSQNGKGGSGARSFLFALARLQLVPAKPLSDFLRQTSKQLLF